MNGLPCDDHDSSSSDDDNDDSRRGGHPYPVTRENYIRNIRFAFNSAEQQLPIGQLKYAQLFFSIMEFDILEQVTSLPSLAKRAVRMLTLRH
ncbi:hypothetical protein RclHR1_01210019 [Rhizophagus clarus]|uniref:Uncharacterized protein n=1 Tax=Rhizophagus clarus TaxID=94130 RepID=A0A2Z6QLD4_9GLOM|nr:hypothetical protein RclHR1_01210019 [Rhizophagus clarus]GES97651.1 hypothetical protein RCL_jg8811.t1 [Rhizophagus clarus]